MSAAPDRIEAKSQAAVEVAEVDGVDLMERLAERDAGAIVDLYRDFGTPLFSFAIKSLGDRGDAEEVLQDSFVRIWNRAGDFDRSRGRPFTWCCLIVRDCCVDRLRQRNALKRGGGKVIALSPEMLADKSTDSRDDVRSIAIWHEQIEMAREAMKLLKPLERRYIEAAIFSGKTHHEIADAAGEPLGTVKSRIRRGLIKLRQALRSSTNRNDS